MRLAYIYIHIYDDPALALVCTDCVCITGACVREESSWTTRRGRPRRQRLSMASGLWTIHSNGNPVFAASSLHVHACMHTCLSVFGWMRTDL